MQIWCVPILHFTQSETFNGIIFIGQLLILGLYFQYLYSMINLNCMWQRTSLVEDCFQSQVLTLLRGSPSHNDIKTIQSVGFSGARNHQNDFLACGLVPFLMIHCMSLPVTSLFDT